MEGHVRRCVRGRMGRACSRRVHWASERVRGRARERGCRRVRGRACEKSRGRARGRAPERARGKGAWEMASERARGGSSAEGFEVSRSFISIY